VAVVGGRIVDPGTAPAGAPTLDAAGLLVAPGFVDLQCNGAAGIDLSTEPERLWEMAAVLPRWGVTAWLPTIVTGPPDLRHRALAAWRAGPPPLDGDRPLATPLGLHFEGPFLAPERRGAHPPEHLAAPDATLVASEGWAGAVALATLALSARRHRLIAPWWPRASWWPPATVGDRGRGLPRTPASPT
jgi:N-acetylglucosamine-6-phosphate deacetylase